MLPAAIVIKDWEESAWTIRDHALDLQYERKNLNEYNVRKDESYLKSNKLVLNYKIFKYKVRHLIKPIDFY